MGTSDPPFYIKPQNPSTINLQVYSIQSPLHPNDWANRRHTYIHTYMHTCIIYIVSSSFTVRIRIGASELSQNRPRIETIWYVSYYKCSGLVDISSKNLVSQLQCTARYVQYLMVLCKSKK